MNIWEDDPDREATWAYVPEADRQFIRRVEGVDLVRPPLRTARDLAAMTADERFMHQWDLDAWHDELPFRSTRATNLILREFRSLSPARPGVGAQLIEVPVLTGPPGAGKTQLFRRIIARQILQLARRRRLLEARDGRRSIDPVRPTQDIAEVVHVELRRRVNERDIYRALLDSRNAPYGKDPQASFSDFLDASETKWIFIDEIQFVNFDGQTGRWVHDALKWLTNSGRILVLCGHNIQWLMRPQKEPAREAARIQSEGRWDLHTLSKMGHGTDAEVDDWTALLRGYDRHLVLAGHGPEADVLSKEFEAYLWVATLGYVNHLSTLVTKAANIAAKTSKQRITRKILDAAKVEVRAQSGRARRLEVFDAGQFAFDYPWSEAASNA